MNPQDYLQHIAGLPRGSAADGEIELLAPSEAPDLDPADVGVVYEDPYIVLFRDAVRFPTGQPGTYLRLCVKPLSTGGGVLVIPRRGDRYLLLRNFRHATRRWEWAFPRGFADPALSLEQSARRETREELGLDVERAELIGHLPADSGLIGSEFHVWEVHVGAAHAIAPESSEAIDASELWELDAAGVLAKVASGEIVDAISIAGFTLSWARAR
jgi:ADP-ribose pyrophosphatase